MMARYIPEKKRSGKRTPGQYTISRVMGEFIGFITGVKRETVQSYFSRENKSLTNFSDCWEYIKEKMKQN